MKAFDRYNSCQLFIVITIGMLLISSCTVKRQAAGTMTKVIDTEVAGKKDSTIDLSEKQRLKAAQQKEKLRSSFKDILEKEVAGLPYPAMVSSFYEKGGYQLILVPRFLPDNQLQNLLEYLNHADRHGLDARLFMADDLKQQLNEVKDYKSSDTVKVHRRLAKLELSVVNSLIRYSIALQYGTVNPAQVYEHYAVPTLLPDSSFVTGIFAIANLKNYLDSIQPKDKTYRALQKALVKLEQDTVTIKEPVAVKNKTTDKLSAVKTMKQNLKEKNKKVIKEKVKPVLSKETRDSLRAQTRQTLVVNMERLRWKNKPAGQKFVLVNITDFSLDVMDEGKSVLHMNVCVGQPGDKQTPQIGSMIRLVQINPVWNIPQSIARNEISRYAADDRYYLANNNIRTFKKGKLIRDTESIDWAAADISEYSFQQQPGSKNSLGKIKFLFANASSVYLHDTPVRTVFKQKMRAISHGCVRVEKPLDLASALFGQDKNYNLVKSGMGSGYPRAKFIGLPQQVPIRLFYYTAWLNDKGALVYAKDIYDLDKVVYEGMQKADISFKP
ncbi:L,D-transpeptidase family protein [Pedobacter lusitanus]|uniref:L,D-transpeptidase family protein n=1 Tax=Pedobacter lusitanus TaxID=1503925 RepID=UPI0009E49783|nr:L,D-transpeptidase family protein [Pedobacter lusitanus]